MLWSLSVLLGLSPLLLDDAPASIKPSDGAPKPSQQQQSGQGKDWASGAALPKEQSAAPAVAAPAVAAPAAAPTVSCVAIKANFTDSWCQNSCGAQISSCPEDICKCGEGAAQESQAKAAKAPQALLGSASGGQLAVNLDAEQEQSAGNSYNVIVSIEPWFPNMYPNGRGLPKHDLLLLTGGSNLYKNAAYLPFVANPYLEDALPVMRNQKSPPVEQERNIDVLYRSSHCKREHSRNALASAVRVALERRNLTFRATGLCKAGGHGAEIVGDGKGGDAWDKGCSECARSKVVLALESCLEGADYLSEKIYLATSYGAIPAYRGNGQGLLDQIGFNRDAMIDRATFASDQDFAEYIAKLVADPTAVKQQMATRTWVSDSADNGVSKSKANVRKLTCKQLDTPGTQLHTIWERAKANGGRRLRIYGAGLAFSPPKTHSDPAAVREHLEKATRLWEELLCLPEDSLVIDNTKSQGADIHVVKPSGTSSPLYRSGSGGTWVGTTPPKVESTCATTHRKLGGGQGAQAYV